MDSKVEGTILLKYFDKVFCFEIWSEPNGFEISNFSLKLSPFSPYSLLHLGQSCFIMDAVLHDFRVFLLIKLDCSIMLQPYTLQPSGALYSAR